MVNDLINERDEKQTVVRHCKYTCYYIFSQTFKKGRSTEHVQLNMARSDHD